MGILEEVAEGAYHTVFATNALAQKSAADRIHCLSKDPGYAKALCEIVLNCAAHHPSVRLFCAIALKNLARHEEISKETGILLCNFAVHVLQAHNEGDLRVEAQLSCMTAKLGLKFWPKSWVDLFPTLHQAVAVADTPQAQSYAWGTLLEVLVEVSTEGRVGCPVPKVALQEVATSSLPSLLSLWQQTANSCNGLPAGPIETWDSSFRHHFIILSKITEVLRIVSLRSTDFLEKANAVGFFESMLYTLEQLAAAARAPGREQQRAPDSDSLQQLLDDIAAGMMQLVVELHKEHSKEMNRVLSPFLQLAQTELLLLTGAHPTTLCTQSLLLLATVLSQPSPACGAVDLTETQIQSMIEMCFRRLLRFSHQELQQWVEDPEWLYLSFQAENDRDSLRVAAESFILAVLGDGHGNGVYSHFLVPRLVGYLKDAQAHAQLLQPRLHGVEFDEIVHMYDALYLCAGLGAWQCGEAIDGNEWFHSILMPLFAGILESPQACALSTGPQLLRRRLLWLLRCWFFQFSVESQCFIMNIALKVIDSSSQSDLLSTLEACFLLETGIENYAFPPEQLASRIPELMRASSQLISVLSEAELQVSVAEVVKKTIDCIGVLVTPYITNLFDAYKSLWGNCSENSPLRSALLEGLVSLVQFSGDKAELLLPNLAPLVVLACSPTESTSHLTSSGLSLWLALERTAGWLTSTPDHGGNQLMRQCLELLLSDPQGIASLVGEDLKQLMLIIECAAFRGIASLKYCEDVLATCYEQILGSVSPQLATIAVRPLLIWAVLCPSNLASLLCTRNLLSIPLKACLAASDGFSRHLSDFAEPDVVLVSYATLLSRVLLAEPSALVTIANTLRQDLAGAVTATSVLQALISVYLSKFRMCGYVSAGLWYQRSWVDFLTKVGADASMHHLVQKEEVEALRGSLAPEEHTLETTVSSLRSDSEGVMCGDDGSEMQPYFLNYMKLLQKDMS